MAYNKTLWKDRIVEKPNTYRKVENSDGTITLYPVTGQVIEKGTPVSAANLNKIENGIVEVYKELDTKIDEVANKGTTTEVLRETTETYIQEKLDDGTIAKLTIEPNSITGDRIKTKAISTRHIDFFDADVGNDIVSLSQVSDIDRRGWFNASGNFVSATNNLNYGTTPLIPIFGSQISTNISGYITFWDANERFKSSYYKGTVDKDEQGLPRLYSVNVPSGAVYYRIAVPLNNESAWNTYKLTYEASTRFKQGITLNPNTFQESLNLSKLLGSNFDDDGIPFSKINRATFEEVLFGLTLLGSNFDDNSIPFSKINRSTFQAVLDELKLGVENFEEGSIPFSKIQGTVYAPGKTKDIDGKAIVDLFDINNIEKGYYYDFNGRKSDGNTAWGSYGTTPLIKIPYPQTIEVDSGGYVTFWDENEQFIRGINHSDSSYTPMIKTQTNEKYIRCAVRYDGVHASNDYINSKGQKRRIRINGGSIVGGGSTTPPSNGGGSTTPPNNGGGSTTPPNIDTSITEKGYYFRDLKITQDNITNNLIDYLIRVLPLDNSNNGSGNTNTAAPTSRWKGKKWNAVGDSITEGPNYLRFTAYPTYISREKGIDMQNYGISGSTIAINSKAPGKPSFIERYSSMRQADLITIFGGTNDYGHNTPLGDFSSRDNTNFYGALHNLIIGLYAKYPDSRFAFFTPLISENSKKNGANALGHSLKDYVNAIKEVTAYYSVPCLDLYTMSNLDPTMSTIKSKYMPDGLHPNNLAHEKILSPKIGAFMETL